MLGLGEGTTRGTTSKMASGDAAQAPGEPVGADDRHHRGSLRRHPRALGPPAGNEKTDVAKYGSTRTDVRLGAAAIALSALVAGAAHGYCECGSGGAAEPADGAGRRYHRGNPPRHDGRPDG